MQFRLGERCHHLLLSTPRVKFSASRRHEWEGAELDGGPGKFIRHGRNQNASQGQSGHECNYNFESSLHVTVFDAGPMDTVASSTLVCRCLGRLLLLYG